MDKFCYQIPYFIYCWRYLLLFWMLDFSGWYIGTWKKCHHLKNGLLNQVWKTFLWDVDLVVLDHWIQFWVVTYSAGMSFHCSSLKNEQNWCEEEKSQVIIKLVVDLSMESKCFMIKLICLWKCFRFQSKKNNQEVLFSRAKLMYVWVFV